MARKVSRKTAKAYKHEDEALLRPDVGRQAQFTKKKAPKTYRPAERRRFTIAHELGHWICQYRRPALFYCRPGDVAAAADRAAEREANVFAAELLMPEPAVRAEFALGRDLADSFGVSGEAMAWRLYNLGLCDDRP